jgi:hypothetical protein
MYLLLVPRVPQKWYSLSVIAHSFIKRAKDVVCYFSILIGIFQPLFYELSYARSNSRLIWREKEVVGDKNI